MECKGTIAYSYYGDTVALHLRLVQTWYPGQQVRDGTELLLDVLANFEFLHQLKFVQKMVCFEKL